MYQSYIWYQHKWEAGQAKTSANGSWTSTNDHKWGQTSMTSQQGQALSTKPSEHDQTNVSKGRSQVSGFNDSGHRHKWATVCTGTDEQEQAQAWENNSICRHMLATTPIRMESTTVGTGADERQCVWAWTDEQQHTQAQANNSTCGCMPTTTPVWAELMMAGTGTDERQCAQAQTNNGRHGHRQGQMMMHAGAWLPPHPYSQCHLQCLTPLPATPMSSSSCPLIILYKQKHLEWIKIKRWQKKWVWYLAQVLGILEAQLGSVWVSATGWLGSESWHTHRFSHRYTCSELQVTQTHAQP